MIQENTTKLDMGGSAKVERLIELLEDDDDVQDVWHNAEYPDEFEA